MDVHIEIKRFEDLENTRLYEILKLRNEIFVVEQKCAYDDIDGNDTNAIHIVVIENDIVVACCRVLKPGVTFPTHAIGRLVTKASCRNKGYARKLMETAIQYIIDVGKTDDIMISAQAYLREFYKSIGFVIVSDEYLDDGIPHYDMKYVKKN